MTAARRRPALPRIAVGLGWKLFLSYLVILGVGVLVLDTAAEFRAPGTLARDSPAIQALITANPLLRSELDGAFETATHEMLLVGTAAGLLVAVAASLVFTRRLVRPIQAMMHASQQIAAGEYRQRVAVAGEDELTGLARAFNRMAATLDTTEQRRLELVGTLAHELRTPLSSISSLMEGLADGVLAADAATFLSVRREVARLQRLVHDLEDLSRAEAGQVALDVQPLAPAALIRQVAARLQPQFDDKAITLTLDLPATLPLVLADSGRVTQVLLNLLGNALHYTPTGGQVQVRAWSAGTQVVITVQDTGIGIAADQLPHIFERFYRVDKSRSRTGGGSGIGLTIAKHLVEAHQGRIWAASPGPGQGSTFSVTLPAAA